METLHLDGTYLSSTQSRLGKQFANDLPLHQVAGNLLDSYEQSRPRTLTQVHVGARAYRGRGSKRKVSSPSR